MHICLFCSIGWGIIGIIHKQKNVKTEVWVSDFGLAIFFLLGTIAGFITS